MKTKLANRQKGFSSFWGGILALGMLVALGVSLVALFSERSSQAPHTASQPQTLSQQFSPVAPFSLTPIVTPRPTDAAGGWQVYNDGTYSFQYPNSWSVHGQYVDYFRGPVVTIKNPSQNVAVSIYPAPLPYGFGAAEEGEVRTLRMAVGENEHTAREIIRSGKKAFVDLKIQKKKEYHIIFGTGYPASPDGFASLSDYNAARGIIFRILSTLVITEH